MATRIISNFTKVPRASGKKFAPSWPPGKNDTFHPAKALRLLPIHLTASEALKSVGGGENVVRSTFSPGERATDFQRLGFPSSDIRYSRLGRLGLQWDVPRPAGGWLCIRCKSSRPLGKAYTDRPSLDDVERLSRGLPSKHKVGSRRVPHRLTAEERKAFELARKKGFVVLKVRSRRYPLGNTFRNLCDATGQPNLRIEQGETGEDDTLVVDLSTLRLDSPALKALLAEVLATADEVLGPEAASSGVREQTSSSLSDDAENSPTPGESEPMRDAHTADMKGVGEEKVDEGGAGEEDKGGRDGDKDEGEGDEREQGPNEAVLSFPCSRQKAKELAQALLDLCATNQKSASAAVEGA